MGGKEEVLNVYTDVPIGLCYLDLDLRYVQINKWLAAINGLAVNEHIGRTVAEVLPEVVESGTVFVGADLGVELIQGSEVPSLFLTRPLGLLALFVAPVLWTTSNLWRWRRPEA